MMTLVGLIAFVVLVVLPGAWITFGLALPGVTFGVRLMAGIMFSPIVVLVQYTIATAVGIPFQPATILLVLANLPAAYLLFRRAEVWAVPSRGMVLGTLAALALPLGLVYARLHDGYVRGYNGHAWLHTEIIYSLARGGLHPEEPQLAGIRLGYPWGGHVYQAVLSWTLDSSPVSSYAWTNVIWLLCIFGLAVAMVRELGGGLRARLISIPLLAFGANCLGYTLTRLVPRSMIDTYPIWGPGRVTPWLRKFYGFDQMAIALGLFAALVYFSFRKWPQNGTAERAVVTGVLLTGLGLIYPILFPAGCAVLGASMIGLFFRDGDSERSRVLAKALWLAGALTLSALITFAHLRFVTAERVPGVMVALDNMWNIKMKSIASAITLFPLWLGLLIVLRPLSRQRTSALVSMLLATAGSVALYVLFWIPNSSNEYKYLFTAAFILVPIASLAAERVARPLGRMAVPALALLAVLMAAPAVHKEYRAWDGIQRGLPALDASDFQLRIAGQPWSAICDSIHALTPVNTIVVAAAVPVSLPTLTGRTLYAPFENRHYTGIGLYIDWVLTAVKGYDPEVLESRRSELRALYYGDDDAARERALDRILAAGRPAAIIVDDGDAGDLSRWIEAGQLGSQLYSADGLRVWLVQPHPGKA